MANEIKISLSITAEKGGAKFIRQESFSDDMAGDAWSTGIVGITASGVQIADLDVGTYGWVYVKNITVGGSLYIDIQSSQNQSDDNICRLYAGESSIFKTSALTALWADSSSGTQQLEFAIIEL